MEHLPAAVHGLRLIFGAILNDDVAFFRATINTKTHRLQISPLKKHPHDLKPACSL